MKLETMKVDELVPYVNNSRTHSDEQIAQIAASIREFGFTNPVLIDDKRNVIAGHGRIAAARKLGLVEVPCIDLGGLTEAKRKALIIADNNLALNAGWDLDILKLELDTLKELDFDIDLLGFDEEFLKTLDKLEPMAGLTDEDDVPEVEQNIHGVVLGDIWKLGGHRLMCGDSADVLQVEKLMNGEKADAVYTDPPYGMNLNTKRAEMKGTWERNTRDYKPVIGDGNEYDPSFLLEYFDKCEEIFLWGADYYAERLKNKNDGSWIVWDKRISEELDAMWGSAFELCWSKNKHKREIARITWAGVCGHSKKDDGDLKVHPTMKPVKLHEWFFEKWFKNKNLIVDIYLGSGSTLIACEKTNRKCYGMEIDPHYCSVIIERWQKFTGKKAERILDV